MNQKEKIANSNQFGRKILDLRKEKGWSQPDLAKKIGTSGAIIGRYERGDMTPSVEVARKIADAFEVTLDYLFNEANTPDVLKDQVMVERWMALNQLPDPDKDKIIYVIDGLIRDARARLAYPANRK